MAEQSDQQAAPKVEHEVEIITMEQALLRVLADIQSRITRIEEQGANAEMTLQHIEGRLALMQSPDGIQHARIVAEPLVEVPANNGRKRRAAKAAEGS